MILLGVASNLQVLGWSLIATLLISTIIAVGVCIVGSVSRTAAARCRAAVAGLVLLALVPFAAFAALRFGVVPPVALWRASNIEPWRTVLIAVAGGWAGGAIVLTAIHIGGRRRLQGLVRASFGPVSEDVDRIARPLVERSGSSPDIRISDDPLLTTPVAVGAIHATILMPASVIENSSPEELRHLLAHELGHVVRRDYAMNCLRILLETLYWFAPAVWWLSRRVCVERECCCDELAVRLCDENPVRYARTLVALDERRQSVTRLAPASTDGDLALRIFRLVGGAGPHRPRGGATAWVAMLGAALIALAGVGPIFAAALAPAQPASETSPREHETIAPEKMPDVHTPAASNGCS